MPRSARRVAPGIQFAAGTATLPAPEAALDKADEPKTRRTPRAALVIGVVVAVAGLSLAKGVLIPFAFAGLLACLLGPLADRLERLRLGRGGSALLAVFLLVGAVGSVGWVAGGEAANLARRVPEYRRTVEEKVEKIRETILGAATTDAEEAARAKPAAGNGAGRDPEKASGPGEPVPVHVVPERPTAIGSLSTAATTLVPVLGAVALVLVLATFLLAYRRDVRDLLIRLMSHGQIGLTTQAFDEASRRVSRWLVTALFVNAFYGVVIGFGLSLLGIPDATLWGVVAAFLRFVPYVGVWIAAAFPVAVALAAFDGWGRAGAVALGTLGFDFVLGNVVEPILYGKRTGLSPLAVVVALVFWTWLWGLPGMFLAVPMTLCAAVAGRYVPGLAFLDVLLRDAPALAPADRAYERLVALDPDAARRVAEARLAESGVEEVLDGIVLAALRRAEADRLRGALDAERVRGVCDGAVEVAEGVERAAAASSGAPVPPARGNALVIPAGGATDAAACEVVAARLRAAGFTSEVGPEGATSGEVAERVAREGPAVAVVASLPPLASTRVRYLVRRLRARAPNVPVLAAVLDPAADREGVETALSNAGARRVAFSLAETARSAQALAGERPAAPRPERATEAADTGARP